MPVPAPGSGAGARERGESRAAEEAVLLVGTSSGGGADIEALLVVIGPEGDETAPIRLRGEDLLEEVRRRERDDGPRWVLRSARELVPVLLAGGVRLAKAWDLTLCHTILRHSSRTGSPLPDWSAPEEHGTDARSEEAALFSWDGTHGLGRSEAEAGAGEERGLEHIAIESIAQFQAQRRAAEADDRLLLLCHAESAGALVAEELHAAGLPWDAAEHDRLLVSMLGPRSSTGVPAGMAALAAEVRGLLGDERVNIDSPPQLLRALHRVGVLVESTGRWELAQHDHPVVAPLLAYKRLSRLHSANGWAWLAEWVQEGRFRPVYVPGGVVTGRWASSGGGALQLPRSLRPAVRADPGWQLVVADVAQLEPRMLAAMSEDRAMAEAARGADLYAGVVAAGAVATREEAKYAMLGAMYGATTGEGGRLVPRLRRVFPRAMALVDDAARTGESGGAVSTWLGRTSPPPSEEWAAAQRRASDADATPADESRARRRAADRGRFTRNFVVQGTAAEWSLIWLAEIRHRLAALPAAATPAPSSGPLFATRAHLAFFLHDEVVVHAPREQAEAAAVAVREAAAVATRRMFGGFPLEVALDLRIAQTAAKDGSLGSAETDADEPEEPSF